VVNVCWPRRRCFDQRVGDGIVVVLTGNPGLELHAGVREAVQVCPAVAITVSEA
jgi:ferredoxin